MGLTEILAAKKVVLDIIDSMTIANKLYQGKIDITEYIDFQDIAGQFNLTQKEYDELINDTQELVDGAVRRYLK
ncbi:MAG: hypothetical protein Q8O10_10295 [candidate division Zixibacteria bacterium]|nr:hypothetical protein [candidate division Zixibacteria bacterium]